MSNFYFGMAVAMGLLSLIPSKREMEMSVPIGSIALAIIAGIFAALSW